MAWSAMCRSILCGSAIRGFPKHRVPTVLLCRGYLKPDIPPLPESYDGSTFKGPLPTKTFTKATSLSSGAGGQCVQKTDSKVTLSFQLDNADWLPVWIRDRIRTMYKRHVSKDGIFSVASEEFRCQRENTDMCHRRIKMMIHQASELPDKPYKETIKGLKKQKKANDRAQVSSTRHQKHKEERLEKYAAGIEAAKAAKEAERAEKLAAREAKSAAKRITMQRTEAVDPA